MNTFEQNVAEGMYEASKDRESLEARAFDGTPVKIVRGLVLTKNASKLKFEIITAAIVENPRMIKKHICLVGRGTGLNGCDIYIYCQQFVSGDPAWLGTQNELTQKSLQPLFDRIK